MDNILIAFKKLLGKGRAWLFPLGFTSEFLDVLASPLVELKNRLISLKYVHFPTYLTDENNISNGEELFGIKDSSSMTLDERAANVEAQWFMFSEIQNYKQIEQILQKKGLPVVVIEDLENYYGELAIGNGNIQVENQTYDPVVVTDNENVFFISANDFLTDEQVNTIIKTVVKNKQAHLVIYFLPRFLRKKEIHHVLKKNEMQTYKKKQYCNAGV